jgi:acetyl esterase/lipase
MMSFLSSLRAITSAAALLSAMCAPLCVHAASDKGPPAVLPAGAQLIADVPYGSDPLQRMDVYLPPASPATGLQRAPVIFMVHGGGWQRGDKTMARVVQAKIDRWLPKGFVFISVNYRLYPNASVAQEAQDVATALATAQGRAATWGADASKFILMGHSAGAHLVSLVNAAPSLALREGAWPWLGAVSLDSAALNMPAVMSGPHYPFYDAVFGTDPAYWASVSPYDVLTAGAQPFQFVCSTLRPDHSCLQSQGMAQHVRAVGTRAQVLPEALTHGEINETLGQDNDYTRAVEIFMGSLDPAVALRLRR